MRPDIARRTSASCDGVGRLRRVATGSHPESSLRAKVSAGSQPDCAGPRTTLQNLTDMRHLPDTELKNLATTSGPKQYLAFDEIARRIRDNPSGWTQQDKPWAWSAIDCTRGPNAREMEWACLRWSQRLNDVEPELEQHQEVRIEELERRLDEDPDSLEVKYHNAIGEKIRRQG